MTRSYVRVGSGIAMAVLPLLAAAQGAGTAEQLARHKEAMVIRLLEGSPLAEEIQRSGNPAAQRELDKARAHFEEARAALAEGRIKDANAALDAAMHATQVARNRLRGADGESAAQMRLRLGVMNSTLEALRKGYLARVAGQGESGDGKLHLIDALIEDGRRLAADGHATEALASLRRAERMLTDAHAAAVGGDTLEYRKQFDSPHRIYEDELARNQSYVELLPIAVAQLRPPPLVAEGLRLGAATNEEARKRAEAAAAAGRLDDAILLLQRATGVLEQLLQDAGLSLGRTPRD